MNLYNKLLREKVTNVKIYDVNSNRHYNQKIIKSRADNLASFLSKYVVAGDRVAIMIPNGIAYFDLLFACSKIEATLSIINPNLTEFEYCNLIDDIQPRIIITTRDHMIDKLVKRYILLDVYSNKYELIVKNKKHRSNDNLDISYSNNIAVIIYTSGSTGKPKGVMLSSETIINNLSNAKKYYNISSEDRFLICTPMHHVSGLFSFPLAVFSAGGEIVIQRKFKTQETLQLIHNNKITKTFFVPTMCYLLSESGDFTKNNLLSLNLILSGGGPPSKSIFKKFVELNIPLINSYGLTECGPHLFINNFESQKEELELLGSPIEGVKIILIDEKGEEVAINEIGEIVIESNTKFSGYWNMPIETEETLRDNKVFTGDLAYRNEKGQYFFVGRKKEVIISGGENIYPREIELLLNEIPFVKQSVILGQEDKKWGEKVVAFILLKCDVESYHKEEIIRYLRKYLSSYKLPKDYYFIKDFPVNSIGKIDRKKMLNSILIDN